MRTLYLLLTFLVAFCGHLSARDLLKEDLRTLLSLNQSFTREQTGEMARFLNQFRGDTIRFKLPADAFFYNFLVERPDTLWLKERPEKKPVLGKHYVLNQYYHRQATPKGYGTSAHDLNGKDFVFLQAEPLRKDSLGFWNPVLLIKVMDLADSVEVNLGLTKEMEEVVTMGLPKIDRMIDGLRGEKWMYQRVPQSPPAYEELLTREGEYAITLENNDRRFLDSRLTLNFANQSGLPLTVPPGLQEINSGQLLSLPEYRLAYEKMMAEKREVTINSEPNPELANDSTVREFMWTRLNPGLGVDSTGMSADMFLWGLPRGEVTYIGQDVSAAKYEGSWGVRYKFYWKPVMIAGVVDVGDDKFYKAIHHGKAFLVNAKDVALDAQSQEKLDVLMASDPFFQEGVLQMSLQYSDNDFQREKEQMVKQLNQYQKNGLVIKDWEIFPPDQYDENKDATNLRITFFNPSREAIKDVAMSVQGYDYAGFPQDGPEKRWGMGPIESLQTAEFWLEPMWYTNSVEGARIESITVEYMSGKTRTISNPDSIMLPEGASLPGGDALSDFN